ncbi:TetR/AcrR family transcriptional regulator [Xinfangfangia pollutisoli]|uniref:TetR/AcrR family transcriptional regulator n=1 Tax=Xinfangfangia pollutisoli TaxID=2865960 RepID=UPI001CD6203E|nr:TetR/AcrR family transcriptional regulator [Xinfangfangia pollutisoli]
MSDVESQKPAEAPPRKLPRDARRLQLIEATIETIARQGYSRTTLSEVARTAGLSHGLVNFHFETKDKLLVETLLYLAEEYRLNWTQAVEAAGPSAPEQLYAMLAADFRPELCTPGRLSAWCAFWGEAQGRPLYQEKCGSNDEEYNRRLEELCARMNAEHGYSGDPVRSARVLRVTTEGVWLDMMTLQAPYPPEEALATVMTCTAAFFPRHFTAQGLIAA